MKYRKLRIAWSVACGIACLLLVVLWVRSYRWHDGTQFPIRSGKDALGVNSERGHLVFIFESPAIGETTGKMWNIDTESETSFSWLPENRIFGFYFRHVETVSIATVPDWLLVLMLGLVGTIPWLRWRYSLRTLLIAMTAAAIGLGWIVYALRN